MSSKLPRNWKPSKTSARPSFASPLQEMQFWKRLPTEISKLGLGCRYQTLWGAISHNQRCHDTNDQIAYNLDSHISCRIAGRKTIPIPIRDICGNGRKDAHQSHKSNTRAKARQPRLR